MNSLAAQACASCIPQVLPKKVISICHGQTTAQEQYADQQLHKRAHPRSRTTKRFNPITMFTHTLENFTVFQIRKLDRIQQLPMDSWFHHRASVCVHSEPSNVEIVAEAKSNFQILTAQVPKSIRACMH